MKNHSLVDGNKRFGQLDLIVLCDLNGYFPAFNDDEAFQLVIDGANSDTEVDEIAARLRLKAISRLGFNPRDADENLDH